MPLIKYYSFSESSGTCYDGRREFSLSQSSQRFYPDEYLIANILNKHLSSQSSRISASSKKIVVLTEKWSGNGGTRDGGKNTDSLNVQIFEAIKKAESDGEVENTLILVPFLYGYHHPGVAIDVKNKVIVYLDPYGVPASRYPEASALQEMAKAENFNFENVTTEQQQRDRDSTSCGPILTISMIKFIEEFLKNGRITKQGFEAPRRNLATDRLFQMYINNTQELKEEKSALDEIMLADEHLWSSVFSEQRLRAVPESEILTIVSAQKAYIQSLRGVVVLDSFNLKKIQSICDFQSRLTELIFINPPDVQSKIKILVDEGRSALAARESDESSLLLSTSPVCLLQPPNIGGVYKNLRLGELSSKDATQQQEEKSFDEEKVSSSPIIASSRVSISPVLEEEKIFNKYNAAQLDCNGLLQRLDEAMKKHGQTTSIYKVAQLVRQEAENLSQSHVMPEGDLKKWKMSVVLALNVLETPKTHEVGKRIAPNFEHEGMSKIQLQTEQNPEYQKAVRLLKGNAERCALGKSDGWKRFKGALAMLAGAAIIGLSIAGIPFTGGASLAGFYVAGSLLTIGGAAFFYHNRQKSLAKETATLAKEANRQLTV